MQSNKPVASAAALAALAAATPLFSGDSPTETLRSIL